jgi:hypothetical protein
LTNEELRRNKLEEEIRDLNKWILEVDKKSKEAESELHKARKKFINAKAVAYLQLQKLRTETQARRETEDELISTSKDLCRTAKELEITKLLLEAPQETKCCMKKEWNSKNEHRTRGGSRKWPTWVVLMICELLISGTRPSAVPSTIHTVYKTLYNKSPEELPSVSFVRTCRVLVEVMGETLTVH